MTRLLTLIGLLFTITLLVKAIFGERGFMALMKIKSEYVSILNEVEKLEEENARLKEEIRKLNDDEYYQEKLARERLGFIKEGEVVFLFPESAQKPFWKKGDNSKHMRDHSLEREKSKD